MKRTIGLGARLIEAIKAKGYPDTSAKYGIRVTDFALDHRYAPQAVFKWISDAVVPDYETMLRLAKDLGTTPGWLHYGDDPPTPTPSRRKPRKLTPISGGSAAAAPRTPDDIIPTERLSRRHYWRDTVSLLRRWLTSGLTIALSPAGA